MISIERTEHLPADVFGLSDVARAALVAGAGFGPVPVPLSLEDIPRPEERLGTEERGVLRDLLAAGARDAGLDLPPEAAASLQALGQEGVFAVVTGQQPGFLASPLYSLYKALQACRAAQELSARWGTPVVPIFWNHADDHDVAEVHHAWQLNRNVDLQKVGLPGLSSGRTPVGDIVLSDEAQTLAAVRAQLHGIVEEHTGATAAVELFAPRDGETLARALSRIFTALLGRFGLVVCEPGWIRPLVSSEMGRIVGGGIAARPTKGEDTLVAALRRGERELAALGLSPAIPIGDADADPEAAAALVYWHDRTNGGNERVALRSGGEGLRRDGESGSRNHAEAASQIVAAPDDWSAGALVRPIVQDAVLPTCAYVGGYGELGYHAQLGPAREAAGLTRTPFLPRVSITLVDDDLAYALTRVETDVRTALAARGAFEPSQGGAAEPAVVGALRELGSKTRERLLEHRAALAELEPALAITLKKTAGHIEQSIGKVIDKAKRVHDNRAGKGARQLRRVNHTLFPRGAPQERVLGPFQFVARFGVDFIDGLWAEMPALSTEHLVLRIQADPADDPGGGPSHQDPA